MKASKSVPILVLIFSGYVFQPTVGASLEDRYEEEVNEDSGIGEIMDASSNRLEGTFMGKDGDGIVFVSEDDGTGKGKLSISTLQGETLFHAVQSQGSHASLVRVGNQAILMHKGNEREDVSLSRIPLTHMSMAETAVAENNKFQTNLLKENLQRISEDEATALLSKIQNDRGYIKNVVEAAHAIASKGITGVENNAARLFFLHAKNLATKSGYLPSTALKSDKPTFMMFDKAMAQEQCTQYATTCPAGKCPYKAGDNDCRGMCGSKCSCWKFLCGDCCVHQGCVDHDECCNESFFGCFLPVGFSCESYSC